MRNYALQKGPCSFLKLRISPWEVSFLFLLYFFSPWHLFLFFFHWWRSFSPISLPLSLVSLAGSSNGARGHSCPGQAAGAGVGGSARARQAPSERARRGSGDPKREPATSGRTEALRGRAARKRRRAARASGGAAARAE
jgi:hypothetical protein